ncbi:type II toxin-antitoxin system prevent-host-death family antitoxin [Kitasatospora sp. NPDC086801]|uniref:type II toxin-antitoxin system prevent-host-death family antitoxin n=1 Tax=Kitasatospora sp. NPDC086801 TaxID=3364066 RepID=UPI003816C35E
MDDEKNKRPMPPWYADLAAELGEPLGVEKARPRWGALVAAAEQGTPTLLTLDTGPEAGHLRWAALVPLDKVPIPQDERDRCPLWPLSDARDRLGDLVAAAGDWQKGYPQILTRHRRPVAAVISASFLVARPLGADPQGGHPPVAERVDLDQLLQDGGTVTLSFDPGVEGFTFEDGSFNEPEPARYIATAADPDGTHVGTGEGDTVAEAMLRLWRIPADQYSTEPPFGDRTTSRNTAPEPREF